MKRILTLMLGITMATVLFTGCKKKNEDVVSEAAPSETTSSEVALSETVPSETTPGEPTMSEPSDDEIIEKRRAMRELQRRVEQEKSKDNSNNKYSLEYLDYVVYNNKQFGIKYVAPKGALIIPKNKAGEMYGNIASQFRNPLFEKSEIEFVCMSEDESQCLSMGINNLKDSNMTLDQFIDSELLLLKASGISYNLSDRNICGRNFKLISVDNFSLLYDKSGNDIITIFTTSNHLLSGFQN